ncbi:MAG: hypothetical protein Q4B28_04180 [bacterium]|nr:hypothetical protein [bacterium]
MQKYWELLQSTQEILALHNKLQNTEEQSFDILGNATPKNQTLYTFSIETA